jgi:superoxide dismutase, Fe-Mn family
MTMAYEAMNFDYLLGMSGFSDQLLKNHFSLYQGYVNNTNKLLDIFARLESENRADSPEYAETKRRFGWEFDGMRLHEYYFRNLGGMGDSSRANDLKQLLTAQYSGYDAWEKDFRATGSIRGIGWAILYQDALNGRLFNCWIGEHDTGHLAGCIPILVMDVWEHAYMLDYGIKRVGYIDAFFANVNWPEAQARVNLELARMYV